MLWHVTALGGPASCGRRGLPRPPGKRMEERRVARGTFQFRFGPCLTTAGLSARLGRSSFSPSGATISRVSVTRTRSTVRTSSHSCERRPPSSAVCARSLCRTDVPRSALRVKWRSAPSASMKCPCPSSGVLDGSVRHAAMWISAWKRSTRSSGPRPRSRSRPRGRKTLPPTRHSPRGQSP